MRDLCLLLLLASAPVAAQTPLPEANEPSADDPVVVRARREAEARVEGDRTRYELDREGLRRSAAWNVLDALGEVAPSLFVTRRSVLGYGLAAGAGGIVSIRGVGGQPNSSVLVTIDGVPSRAALFGHPLQDLYMPEALERAEVLAGGASDLLGGSALGGAIRLETRRRRTEGFETELASRYGRWQTFEETLAHGGKQGPWDYYVTGGWRGTEGHRDNASFWQSNGTLRLGRELGAGFSTSLNVRASRFRAEDPFQAASDLVQRVSRRGATWMLEEDREDAKGRISLSYDWGDHAFTDGWDSRDWTMGLSAWRSMRLDENLEIAAGADYTRYGGEAWANSRALYRGRRELNELSGFGRATARLGGGFRFTGGVRLARVSDQDPVLLPTASLSWEEEVAEWRPSVRAGWTRSFRAPTVAELHYPMPASNRDLEPEEADTFELAGRIRRDVYSWEVILFATAGKDAILRQGPPPPFSIDNSGAYHHRGVESVFAAGTDRLGLRAGAAYLHHDGISPGAFRARFTCSAHAGSGEPAEGGIGWHVKLASETLLDLWGQPGARSHEEDYTLLSLSGSLEPLGWLELSAGIENLSDIRYYQIGNLPAPGRTFWVGARAAF